MRDLTSKTPGCLDKQDLHDLICAALQDSMDMDWTCTTGANYVVAALVEAGAVTLTVESDEEDDYDPVREHGTLYARNGSVVG